MMHACGTLTVPPDDATPDAGPTCLFPGQLSTSQNGAAKLEAEGNALLYTSTGSGEAYANALVPIPKGTSHVSVVFTYSDFTYVGSWAATGNPYINLAGVAYGGAVDAHPQVRATFARNGVDLNAFHVGDALPDTAAATTPQPTGSNGQIVFDVDFKTQGVVTMTAGKANALVYYGDLGSATPPNAVMVFVGGSAGDGMTPSTSITFTSICVTAR